MVSAPSFVTVFNLTLERLDLDLSGLRSLGLREPDCQDAVFQVSRYFRGVCGNRQPHHAAEGPDVTLAAHVNRFIILHALSLPLDRKLIADDGNIEVVQTEAWKLELGLEVVLRLPHIHGRGAPGRQRRNIADWHIREEAGEPTIQFVAKAVSSDGSI